MIQISPHDLVVRYTNWRGRTSRRRLRPISLWHGSTEWHPEPQWLLKAVDHQRGPEPRDFALADMAGLTEVERVVTETLERQSLESRALQAVVEQVSDGDFITMIALAQLWRMLGVKNQTAAVQALRALLPEDETPA